jgi:hypothetical protein
MPELSAWAAYSDLMGIGPAAGALRSLKEGTDQNRRTQWPGMYSYRLRTTFQRGLMYS